MKALPLFLIALMLMSCGDDTRRDTQQDVTTDVLVAQTEPASVPYDNSGQTVPKPVFQVGDQPSVPFTDASQQAQDFVQFFNKTYFAGDDFSLPVLDKTQVVWFPPQSEGDTSLELVGRVTQGEVANCDEPDGYPILCSEGFSTGEFCKACHDSALYVEGGGLPQMAYFSEAYSQEQHEVWLANWSQYGDWSSNIMRLATRDPIWQAQIETETNQHPYADPAVIQDVCFSCHGEMGERQLKEDFKKSGIAAAFCTDIFYATIPGVLGDYHSQGKAYQPTGDCDAILKKSVKDNPHFFARYGSLARDGVSCETCHRIGPETGGGQWNGTDFEVFYGMKDPGPDAPIPNVARRQDNPQPLMYEFTATFQFDMDSILTPDPVAELDPVPMSRDDNLAIAQGYNEKTHSTYFGQSVLCGACHVLIVPKIPTAFKPDGLLPDDPSFGDTYKYYNRPDACAESVKTFAPATNGKYGNPLTDNCVELGYEQATYLEWINSSFASEEDNENTCQACHMPFVTDPENGGDHTAIMAQSTNGLIPKDYRRHRLMGINLPVFEMYMQFPDVLGVDKVDDLVPPSGISITGQEAPFIQNYLLNGQMAIVEQATSQATGNGLQTNSLKANAQAAAEVRVDNAQSVDGLLIADVTVINNTGHKFPSGAGFRRAFLRFEILDAAQNVLWISGDTNPYGAICDGACVEQADGTYNLVGSEVTGGEPGNLQPHYQVINQQNQVQIYEVQAVNDNGQLTSRTLSLFWDAKDNRLLPRGFKQPGELACQSNPSAGTEIFGISQCSAAYATESQLSPLTVGSAISQDPHYTNSTLAGSDQLSYQVSLDGINGSPASVRVTMQYQTIPPAYLASRFSDGYDENTDQFLQATERSIYLTSHLNTNLPLKSEHPDNTDLTFSKNWTQSLHQSSATFSENVVCRVFNDGDGQQSTFADAVYFAGSSQSCIPDDTDYGTCRKWFGLCQGEKTGTLVNFKVFNADGEEQSISSNAVYPSGANSSCIPDGSEQGLCRTQFGMAEAGNKKVRCALFNDGYTDITVHTDAIVYKGSGQVCLAEDPKTCRKWFGLCEIGSAD